MYTISKGLSPCLINFLAYFLQKLFILSHKLVNCLPLRIWGCKVLNIFLSNVHEQAKIKETLPKTAKKSLVIGKLTTFNYRSKNCTKKQYLIDEELWYFYSRSHKFNVILAVLMKYKSKVWLEKTISWERLDSAWAAKASTNFS